VIEPRHPDVSDSRAAVPRLTPIPGRLADPDHAAAARRG